MARVRTYIGSDGELYERVPLSELESGDELDSREQQSRDDGSPS